MTPERWNRVKDLFVEASTLDEDAQRLFLNDACDDPELRAEIDSMLHAHATSDAVLDRPAVEHFPPGNFEATEEDWRGRRVGVYELTSCLGRGGMGEVWRARRADTQYVKEVAVKLVRIGYDTAFVLQRFKAERQILATLEHPNIARLIDGGMTLEGQPYLVMELVEGRPLDEYCETGNLPIAERLRLFREVCAAVSYAHRHLVVHRDLKPANILVSADGSIKLLDFGIAKLLLPSGADAVGTDAARTTMRALTPAYSSPEQLLGLAITTASDVYSLGVVLFHLLAGRSPYRTTLTSTRDAILDVCEAEPLKPSAAAMQVVSTGRARALPDAELDDITLKALRKESDKRYSSVEQFSEDLRRYMAGLPVLARGDRFAYRAGKFLRRRRVELAAGGLVVLALLAGVVVAQHEARIAVAQRARAERHFASVRALANTFMFQMDDSIRNLPGSTAARVLLVKTALSYLDTLSKESSDDPGLQLELAQAYDKVADIQGQTNAPNTGEEHASMDSYDKAITLLKPLASTSGNMQAQYVLARTQLKRSRTSLMLDGDAKLAARESQQALSLLVNLAAAQPQNPQYVQTLGVAYGFHAVHLMWSGQTELAISSAYKFIAIFEPLFAAHPDDVDIQFRLGNAYADAGVVLEGRGVDAATIEESISLERKGLAIFEQALQAHPKLATRMGRSLGSAHLNFGDELFVRGDHAAAMAQYQSAAEIFEKDLVDTNNFQARLDSAKITHRIAAVLLAMGRIEAAVASNAKGLEVLRALAVQSDNLEVKYNLAACEMEMGRIEVQRVAVDTNQSVQARLVHWRAAQDWFAASVPKFQRILQGVVLAPQDHQRYEWAVSGLAESEGAIARLTH